MSVYRKQFDEVLGIGVSYVGLAFGSANQGAVQVSWFDGAASATSIELQGSLWDPTVAPVGQDETGAPGISYWAADAAGTTFPGPAATAAGTSITPIADLGGVRWRAKITMAVGGRLAIHTRPSDK